MSESITNSIGMQLVLIPAGSFRMGGDKILEQADDRENPRHMVKIGDPFYMCKHQVTQAHWVQVMQHNPSEFKGDLRPVESVSWDDVQAFIRQLNAKEEDAAYRLPTEAEWEYAARAKSQEAYCFGGDVATLSRYAWYKNNSGGETHPVGQLRPNAWGLYDMHGNVHEWVQDWFDRKYYSQSPSVSPQGPASGLAKALRGGDWGSEDWYCRSASRSLGSPDRRSNRLGFRLIKTV